MTREQMIAIVTERSAGATPAVDPCRVYDASGAYVWFDENATELDVCERCADKLVERRSTGTDSIEVFPRGEKTDVIHSCGGCGCPLLDVLTKDGAEDELSHWETHGAPKDAGEWREFGLMVQSIPDEHLPRVVPFLSTGA